MKKINKTLKGVTESLGLSELIEKQRAVMVWDKVVGEEIKRRTIAEHVKDKTLYVRVKNSAWISELHMCENMLLGKINKRTKEPINSIRFIVDPGINDHNEEPDNSSRELTEKEKGLLISIAENIEDEDIKDVFMSAYMKYLINSANSATTEV